MINKFYLVDTLVYSVQVLYTVEVNYKGHEIN